ncbi:MAG: ribosome maturation factor RimM [Lachnospiraceae bacterium]|nr:ribosome maturation factor RimM [Lachnospiraceae bacterium]
MQNILRVGAVTTTHGLAGEVKVFPTTDDPARFRSLKSVLIETNTNAVSGHAQRSDTGVKYSGSKDAAASNPDTLRELEVERVRFFKNLVIVKFRGLDRIEDVEGFRGCSLYVTRENAVKLEEGEYFIADLLGLHVYTDEDSSLFGTLTDVLQTGANDVYEVTLQDGRQVLIPAIRQCILDVDIENGSMRIHLLEGLLE